MQIMVIAKVKHVIDFTLNPSPFNKYVRSANEMMPMQKPIILDGHNAPSKYITQYLVAFMKIYDIGIPRNTDMKSGLRSTHFHTNCPLV